MTEDVVEEEKQEESFADLFEAYDNNVSEDIQLGDKLKGKIISIGRESVFVDTGSKIDGVVDRAELLDENLELPYKEGDTLELFVVANNGSEIRLSKVFSGAGNIMILEEAFYKKVPVEGRVKAECKGGFQVDVMGKRAFCPISQMDIRYVESGEDYIGETFPFLITQFDEDGRNIVISRRKILEKELEEKKKLFFEEIAVGDQREGRVTKMMPYGAFVELLPCIEGMIHISEMSWSRTKRPEEILKKDDRVVVKIIGLEQGKGPGDMKLSLSMKQVTGDPWNNVESIFRIGDKIKGTVSRCVNFGAFVEISEGIEGLVHISEMSYKKRILKPEDVVKEGDRVEVMVKEIDADNRRISLSMRDAEGDPWIGISERYKTGQSVKGILEKKENFGYFVSLEPGITGLVPISKIKSMDKPSAAEKLAGGASITVIIESIDLEGRRISLIPGDATDEADWKNYKSDSGPAMGSLGLKLQAALNKKNRNK